jgi:hypothetical protein
MRGSGESKRSVFAAWAAGALLVTAAASTAAASTSPHEAARRASVLGHGVYRGSIQESSRGRSSPDDNPSPIRGGSVLKTRLGVSLGSLHFNLWNGTPDEALKQVTPALRGACLMVHHMLWTILARTLWGCLGIEVGAGHVPPAGRGSVARGPIGEVLKCVKSAGESLANVEVDFVDACKHSLTQISRLALGHLPVLDCDSTEEEDDTGAMDKGTHASADFGTRPGGRSGIQHVYLRKAAAAATPTTPTVVSPIHTHTHGLHACPTPGCPTSAGLPPVISDSDLESDEER